MNRAFWAQLVYEFEIIHTQFLHTINRSCAQHMIAPTVWNRTDKFRNHLFDMMKRTLKIPRTKTGQRRTAKSPCNSWMNGNRIYDDDDDDGAALVHISHFTF